MSQCSIPEAFKERVLSLNKEVYLMVDMMYYSSAVEIFKDSNVVIGQLSISNVIPTLKTNDSDSYTETILGLKFKPVQS